LKPPYSISNSLSRRQFLKGTLLGCIALKESFLPGFTKAFLLPKTSHFCYINLKSYALTVETLEPKVFAPLGSVMKLLSATFLLEHSLLTPSQIFECKGTLNLHGQVFHCRHPHGVVSLKQALAYSCNVYFAQAAERVSAAEFYTYLQKFPFTFLDASHQDVYAHPNSSQKLMLGLSNSVQVDCFQMLALASYFATESKLNSMKTVGEPIIQPKYQSVCHSLWPKDILTPPPPILKPSTLQVIQESMVLSAREGTGKNVDPLNQYHLACKTGTTPYGHHYKSWVMGFFPHEDPRFAFALRCQSGASLEYAIPSLKNALDSRSWD
jgi:membrane peptidoglycan carboxypeptidase